MNDETIRNAKVGDEKRISSSASGVPQIAQAVSQALSGVSPGWVLALVIMVAIIETAAYFEHANWADRVDGAVVGAGGYCAESLGRCQDSLEKLVDRCATR